MSRIERRNKRIKRLKRTRFIADTVIVLCLLVIMGICAHKIFSISEEYKENQEKYVEISESKFDFDALRKINPDVVGWIEYEGTQINYPIVKGEDNEKYLTAMFDGSESSFGTLFVDCITKSPFKQFNTIVYGHHMRNGSMLAALEKLKEESFAEEHPVMKLYTPAGDYALRIWAFLNVPSDSVVYSTNLRDSEIGNYLNRVAEEALYTKGTAGKDDKFVVLSTCAYEYDDARYVVVAKIEK